MKLYALLFFLFLCADYPSFAQKVDSAGISRDAIDAYALRAPVSVTRSVETLSDYLVKPYTSEEHKVRSIYAWVAGSLTYDHQMAKKEKRSFVTNQYTLRTRKAVCSGYAQLFQSLCQKANIKAEFIGGYTRDYNMKSKRPFSWSEHAWNAVLIDSIWHLLDATWELKIVKKEKRAKDGKILQKKKIEVGNRYYLLQPQEFVQDHLPEIPAWQLLDCPLSLEHV